MNGATKRIPQVPVVADVDTVAVWAWREAMRGYLLSMQAVHGQVVVLFRKVLDTPEFVEWFQGLDAVQHREVRDAVAFLRNDTQGASEAWAGVEAAKEHLP